MLVTMENLTRYSDSLDFGMYNLHLNCPHFISTEILEKICTETVFRKKRWFSN